MEIFITIIFMWALITTFLAITNIGACIADYKSNIVPFSHIACCSIFWSIIFHYFAFGM